MQIELLNVKYGESSEDTLAIRKALHCLFPEDISVSNIWDEEMSICIRKFQESIERDPTGVLIIPEAVVLGQNPCNPFTVETHGSVAYHL